MSDAQLKTSTTPCVIHLPRLIRVQSDSWELRRQLTEYDDIAVLTVIYPA